jgi:hypothetical protein
VSCARAEEERRQWGIVSSAGFFGAAKTEFSPPFVDLPARLEAGATWTWEGSSKGAHMEIRSVFVGLETVKVAAGEFRCARVERHMPQVPAHVTVHWYAEGVGLVKMQGKRPAAIVVPESRLSLALTAFVVK